MKRFSRLMMLLPVTLFAACGGGSDSTGIPVTGGTGSTAPEQVAPSGPQSGDWAVDTDFGTFTFTVDASGTSVDQVAYQFSSFTCGSVTHSGGITVSRPDGWPITGSEFDIRNDMSPMMSLVVTVTGTFHSSTAASGTWEILSNGTSCSGNWTSS